MMVQNFDPATVDDRRQMHVFGRTDRGSTGPTVVQLVVFLSPLLCFIALVSCVSVMMLLLELVSFYTNQMHVVSYGIVPETRMRVHTRLMII